MLGLAIFIGLPILELLLLIQAGAAFGFWWTLAWIFVSAIIGITLVRIQGLSVIRQAEEARMRDEPPVGAILTGIRLAFAGIFMVIPGFITDALGLLLLLPWTGNALGRTMASRVHMRSGWSGRFGGAWHTSEAPGADSGRTGSPTVVEADFEVVQPGSDEPPDAPPRAIGKGNPWERGGNR